MDTDTRFRLVSQNLQEIITPDELRVLLENKDHPRGYVGFEPSGMMHAGTGLIVGKKMSDYVEAGFHFIIFLADWHGWINNKMDGDMDSIRSAGEYFKDCFTALGLPPGKVEYIWTSDFVDSKEYWEKGRSADSVDVEAAWALYPAMQTSDIFHMDLDVAAAGMDQRKVHMLAREVAPKLGYKVPVCLHNSLLPSLQDTSINGDFDEDEVINKTIRGKMSKSVDKGAIWVNDSPEVVREKYHDAFCPEKQVIDNPVLDHARMLVFPNLGELYIKRPSKYGGDVSFHTFEELAETYSKGELHPLDLKKGVAEAVNILLKPVAEYFERKPENLRKMQALRVTR